MGVAQHISEADYEQIVWADPDRNWELVEGRLREKPGMSWEHGEILILLGHLLLRQLDRRQFSVLGESRVRRPPGNIFIPDLFVVPVAYGEEFRNRPGVLAIISQPLPLVVEVWSRSTGDYDVEAKIPIYQQRGDLEIWRIHPYERTLTAWRRQPGRNLCRDRLPEGTVSPSTLPGVTIHIWPSCSTFDSGAFVLTQPAYSDTRAPQAEGESREAERSRTVGGTALIRLPSKNRETP